MDCIKDKEVHVKVRARLLDFEMYNCKWKAGKSMWQAQNNVVNFAHDPAPSDSEVAIPPKWVHKGDIEIRRPSVQA